MTSPRPRFARTSYYNRLVRLANELNWWVGTYNGMLTNEDAWRHDVYQLEVAHWRASVLEPIAQELVNIALQIDNLR